MDRCWNFSESVQLLEFLSESPLPSGLVVNKRVSIVRGWRAALRILRHLPAIVCMNLAAHLTWLRVTRGYVSSDGSGKAGEELGAVVVLILSTSKRERTLGRGP
jgi:hypothetical protein